MKWYCMKDENTYIFSPVPLYSNYFQGTLIRSAHQIYRFCKGALVFRDGSELHFKEFIDTEAGITKYKYGYHYQKADSMIFRYDNHPHPARKDIPYCHKHVSTEENMISASIPDLEDILKEVIMYLP